MRFGPVQKTFFNAFDGAYSRVTPREVIDSQITLTGEEVELVESFFGRSGIHHGNVKSNRQAASKPFVLFGPERKKINLNLVYCKGKKFELRLYIRKNIFFPEPNSIWFLYVSGSSLVIGAMSEEKWRSLGREDVDDDSYIADIYNEPTPIEYTLVSGGLVLKRNPELAIARFKLANYKCEVDPSHKLFTARATNLPFLEAHHLLPMKHQESFSDSLDLAENIAALCPFCHRLVHHASVKETRPILEALFANRKPLIERFKVSKNAVFRFYNCEEILSA